MKTSPPKIHLVANSHIDPVWMWRWQEGSEVIRATFSSVLSLMDELPDFKFIASSAAFYEWVERVDPKLFNQIKKRVKEGRWGLVGGWWVEPDCNLPSGESLVRQGLYGQKYFKKKFGRYVTTAFNPDSFGHAGTLPQILKKLGFQNYVFFRPEPQVEMRGLPSIPFWWEGKDGSTVLAYRPPASSRLLYTTDGSAACIERRIKSLSGLKKLPQLCLYGKGDHGGGMTKDEILTIKRIQNQRRDVIIFSTLDEFFSDLRKTRTERVELPTVKTELQRHAVGCYSAHSEVKRLNRECEHLLMAAERFSAIASFAFGCKYPQESLTEAWKTLLFNQFHDVSGGVCIAKAYEDVKDGYGEVRQKALNALNFALQTIAKNINLKETALVIFNPLPWFRKEPVSFDPYDLRFYKGEISVHSERGKIPCQLVKSPRVGKKSVQFIVETPALGYSCYKVVGREEGEEKATKVCGQLKADNNGLENDFWRISAGVDGSLLKLYDKRNKVEVCRILLKVLRDKSDTWSHGIDRYDEEVGLFGEPEIYLDEIGDVQATLRIITRYNKSLIEHFVTVYREIDRIDFRARINWQESWHLLKLSFETNLQNPEVFYDIPYGWIQREVNGLEVPGQKWSCLEGEAPNTQAKLVRYGLAVLNDSKYGFDARGGELRITILRSPPYAYSTYPTYKEPAKMSGSEEFIDQGWQTVRYSLLSYKGSWRRAEVPQKAWEFNEPLIVNQEHAHKGKLPTYHSFLEVSPSNAVLAVLKRDENSRDFIVRVYETTGNHCTARVISPYFGFSSTFKLKANEIKTLKLTKTNSKSWKVSEVNLLEE